MLLRIVECMFESLELYIVVCIIHPFHQIDQRVSEEEDINFPKVPPNHICTTPVKCPPKENEEYLRERQVVFCLGMCPTSYGIMFSWFW